MFLAFRFLQSLGLSIAVRFSIDERPQTIWRPLERSLRSCDERLRGVGFVSLCLCIGRGAGEANSAFVHSAFKEAVA
jgi:hypothetical protein